MKPNPRKTQPRGFALVVTLSLMILLTVIAVGLLTMSTITLRSSGHGNAMSTARANARLALMIAIGDLQKNAGPDTRITAPANLLNDNAAPGITGVWKSWRPTPTDTGYAAAKEGDRFLGYLMSNPEPESPDPLTLPQPVGGKTARLVGPGSVGTGDPSRFITAPLVSVGGANAASPGSMAWVTMDEGVKSRIDLLPENDASGEGEEVARAGSPARNGFEGVPQLDFLNEERDKLLVSLPKIASFEQLDLAAKSKEAATTHFHDFTVNSDSVQADVAKGGLKRDLSVLFDGNYGANLPADYRDKYVYSEGAAPYEGNATNSDPRWTLYANYARLYRKTAATDNPKNGIRATNSGMTLKTIYDKVLKKNRYEPNMGSLRQPLLMPTVLRVDMIFSLIARDAHSPHNSNPTYPMMLHLMYLPVITLHNPYNVPLKVTNLVAEFSDIPVGFEFLVNGQATNSRGLLSMNEFYTGKEGQRKVFSMTLSNSLSGATEVTMGPGETRIFGTPFPPNATWAQEVSANGKNFFDWESNKTGAVKSMPGMICGSQEGVGFDVDWLAPDNGRAAWVTARRNHGVVLLKADDQIQVRYGPRAPASSGNAFTVALKLNGTATGTTQVFYKDNAQLQKLMEEGVSPRFPEARKFPETFPRSGSHSITAFDIHEGNTTPVSEYEKAKPFAVFSVGAKTTVESFSRSRPVADTGISFQMATCDMTGAATQGTSPLECSLVPVADGGFVIESGGLASDATPLQAFFFGGHGINKGTTNATFFEIPMAPLQSIAQLRHANAGSIGSVPYVTYTVGESRSHPAIPSNVAFHQAEGDSSRNLLDHSWLSNDRLWDGYWFSTLSTLQGVAYTGSAAKTQQELSTEFFEGKTRLPNPRNTAHKLPGKSAEEAATEAIADDGKKTASYVMTRGGFNVNSTSEVAWRSVLTSMVKADVPLAAGGKDTDPDGTPFLRVRKPVAGSSSGVTDREKLWNSYRTIDKDEVEKLAKEIVVEVKKRGPFLSMSEFVNRRLEQPGDLSRSGAIQAAIDRTDINSIMESNALGIGPGDVADYGWQNKDAVTRNTGAGAPGEISQGDVLSAIGSFVSVRSDTFRIRAYGEAHSKNGTVIARAWCEATLQRFPEYVNTIDAPEVDPVDPANLQFGRQFKIVAFRWLNRDDV